MAEDPTWWRDPLSYAENEATAGNVAEHVANGSREPGTNPDAYVPARENLLNAFLLAASLDSVPVTQAYTKLTQPHGQASAEPLRTAGMTYPRTRSAYSRLLTLRLSASAVLLAGSVVQGLESGA
ncbi:hypothetical protein QK292_17630 [Arthrobacter sp. AL08]|uniref:hypothetical protein n=1 Tax=unclassified Arthrobacter TaxID=235627 RepID=UPI00249B7E02|nr:MULTISPECIES: hypothetical protein [unclassified Arthrobacter]MDI3243364.1 hypothetical protein [Arthrobacter sp. AL05]MDI3279373.1 hypothetical protein [Arthrobacter sp. AL08]